MSRGDTLSIQTTVEFHIESCYACGCEFAMTVDFYKNRMRMKDTFYCPAGHGQCYTGKSDKQLRLEAEAALRAAEDQLHAAQQETKLALKHMRDAKREQSRQAQRSRGGVCPCCDRSFVQLARHMKTKHPEHGKVLP